MAFSLNDAILIEKKILKSPSAAATATSTNCLLACVKTTEGSIEKH
jgi:hypothetical protein